MKSTHKLSCESLSIAEMTLLISISFRREVKFCALFLPSGPKVLFSSSTSRRALLASSSACAFRASCRSNQIELIVSATLYRNIVKPGANDYEHARQQNSDRVYEHVPAAGKDYQVTMRRLLYKPIIFAYCTRIMTRHCLPCFVHMKPPTPPRQPRSTSMHA
jgi:hypothetical protein